MGIWADMIKVMKSKLFADTLRNGNYEVSKSKEADSARVLRYGALASGTDLNDITTFGDYIRSGSSHLITLYNSPTAHAFYMQVTSSGAGIRQEITTYDNNNSRKYYRTYYMYDGVGGWGPWKEIASTLKCDINVDFSGLNCNLALKYFSCGNATTTIITSSKSSQSIYVDVGSPIMYYHSYGNNIIASGSINTTLNTVGILESTFERRTGMSLDTLFSELGGPYNFNDERHYFYSITALRSGSINLEPKRSG